MKYLFLLFFPAFTLHAQFLWQVYPDTIIKWNYTDGDEFNKNEINKDKWTTSFPWTITVPSQEAVIRENNIKFNNGIASFIVDKDSSLVKLNDWQIDTLRFKKLGIKLLAGNKMPVKYSLGLLWSNKTYKYGYFEIKFKACDGKGLWPAFWMYAANKNNEIDFLELKGEKEKYLHVDIHCPDGCGNYKKNLFGVGQKWGHWLKTEQRLKSSYNVMAGEWTPTFIKYYLNGKLVAYVEHAYDMGMHLIVGNGIAKDGAPFKPGPDKATPFPNPFFVDYVRIYKTDTLPNLTIIKENLALTKFISNEADTSSFVSDKANKKLINNRNNNLKSKNVLTISIMPLSKSSMSFRAIGLANGDTLVATFKNSNGDLIKYLEVKKNSETVISFTEGSSIDFQLTINEKIIKENLTIR